MTFHYRSTISAYPEKILGDLESFFRILKEFHGVICKLAHLLMLANTAAFVELINNLNIFINDSSTAFLLKSS